jgi:hypothetical protein
MTHGSKTVRSGRAAAITRRGSSILLYLIGSVGLAAMGSIPLSVIGDGVSGSNFDQMIVGFIMLLFFEAIPITLILAGMSLSPSPRPMFAARRQML